MNALVPLHCRHRGQQHGEGLQRSLALDVVGGLLLDAYEGTYRGAVVLVAGGLAAPGRTVYGSYPTFDADNGVVVIEQFAAFNVCQP